MLVARILGLRGTGLQFEQQGGSLLVRASARVGMNDDGRPSGLQRQSSGQWFEATMMRFVCDSRTEY
jgi:hypothetical protein